jgi:hypothetical protein
VGGSGEFLQLVFNDLWFAWLRPVSELIVSIDEQSPDAVLAHGELSRLLPRPEAAPIGEAEIDRNLAEPDSIARIAVQVISPFRECF